MMKDNEYEQPTCDLTGEICDKNCPLWDSCPYEEHDVADHRFVTRVVNYLKEKFV